jgi:hypothetical protein
MFVGMQEAHMLRFLPLMLVITALPVQAADREGPRQRERDAAYQLMARHPVTERYRYYVPTSAFSQRRRDEPRAHAKWVPQPLLVGTDPAW